MTQVSGPKRLAVSPLCAVYEALSEPAGEVLQAPAFLRASLLALLHLLPHVRYHIDRMVMEREAIVKMG